MSPEAWSALANWVMAGAAAGGAVAAFQGLNAWKRQGIWLADNDCAKRLLRSAYNYRDSISAFRQPLISPQEAEMIGPSDEAEADFDGEMKLKKPVFFQRAKFVGERSTALDVELQEARFLWGEPLPEAFSDIREFEVEIGNFIESYYISLPRMKPTLQTAIHTQLEDMRGVVNSSFDIEGVHETRLDANISEIEKFLRAKVGRAK